MWFPFFTGKEFLGNLIKVEFAEKRVPKGGFRGGGGRGTVNGRQKGEKLLKAEKAFKGWNQAVYYRNTEQDIIALPPGFKRNIMKRIDGLARRCLIDPLHSKLILQIGF